ncbi:MAG TPA: 1-(5-phosphoribosyl)-5-[(5-phosphoribosylamino)methylideneamino]imidazole-4-carboxamide isomerase [Gemmatimonadaceae bacterium]
MIVIPAVDLREGQCVQLEGGDYDRERLRLEDPLEVARGWARVGFRRLHLVDLDAATGRGSNAELVREILRDVDADVQVGGGIRSGDDIERLLREGADRVVVGTRALEDREWLAGTASTFANELVVAVDARDRRVVTRGWSRTLSRNVLDVVEELNELPLAAILVTAVHREGQMMGTDLFLMEDVAELSAHPVIASGGIASVRDLRELDERGVAGAVVGMALYTGAIDARYLAEEFAE